MLETQLDPSLVSFWTLLLLSGRFLVGREPLLGAGRMGDE